MSEKKKKKKKITIVVNYSNFQVELELSQKAEYDEGFYYFDSQVLFY